MLNKRYLVKNIKLNIKSEFIPAGQEYLREPCSKLFMISDNYYYEYHTFNNK